LFHIRLSEPHKHPIRGYILIIIFEDCGFLGLLRDALGVGFDGYGLGDVVRSERLREVGPLVLLNGLLGVYEGSRTQIELD
jgi:hypothetical protein